MNDDQFLDAFENCSLPPESFHHADHVRLAWLYLDRNTAIDALRAFAGALQKYASSLGRSSLYHETITWAFVAIIHQRMFERPASGWEEFARTNPDLITWHPSVLDQYYQPATLRSEMARRVFVFPDRLSDSVATVQVSPVSRESSEDPRR